MAVPSRDLPHGRGQPGDARRDKPVGGVARPELAELAAAADKECAVIAHRGAVVAPGGSSHPGVLCLSEQLPSPVLQHPPGSRASGKKKTRVRRQGMAGMAKVTRSFYRIVLRTAKLHDAHPALKGLIVSQRLRFYDRQNKVRQ